MTEARIPHQELLPLPRWARLALALRCIQRARSLLHAPADSLRVLDQALGRLNHAVRTGEAGDDLAEAAASAYTLALDHLDEPAQARTDEDTVVVTCMVAHATAFAAEAATLSEARRAAPLVGQAVDFAVHAHRLAQKGGTEKALAEMRADLARLLRDAAAQGWTDQTPVPDA